MRPKGSRNKKLSRERLYQLSTETLAIAMIEFIAKIKTETLTEQQKIKLKELYTKFLEIQNAT